MSLENLGILFEPTYILPLVGEKTFAALQRLDCTRIIDLLLHFPYDVIERVFYPDLNKVKPKTLVVIELTIQDIEHTFTRSRKKIVKIHGFDSHNHVTLVYFNFAPHYIINKLVIGNKYIVLGKLEIIGVAEYQIAHPEIHCSDSYLKKLEPKYSLSYAITSRQVASLVKYCIEMLPQMAEWLPEEMLRKYHWSGWLESIIALHNPTSNQDLHPNSILRQRLVFDELLASQLALKLIRRNKNLLSKGRAITINHHLRNNMLRNLGFILTDGQKKVLGEIEQDQACYIRMTRLLQGDVGSGKTLVALCSMLNVVAAGKQTALMVPTDILANQHFQWIVRALNDSSGAVALLTGNSKKSQRAHILTQLQAGKIQILVGTHALFQKGVEFKNLQLIVIDEQHRFGVEQRLSLMDKDKNCDVLVMSATPIPRTLALTVYGDMDISVLSDKPKGRIPIQTATISINRAEEVIAAMKRKLDADERVFWVCQMIETMQIEEQKTVSSDLIAVIDRYNYLSHVFGAEYVGLIHGKLSATDKDLAMADFANGKTKILVATTVIEVGIDVPEATLLVVENAERFGLAQLHQLRGRVGRGPKKSDCILLYGKMISQDGKARLQILRNSNDGFYIAEEDLRLRGGGDVLGCKQSGVPQFRIADFEFHQEILQEASQLAERILSLDGQLQEEGNKKLHILLHLFDYKKHLDFIYAG